MVIKEEITMTEFIKVHLDESEKWLDKRRTMTDNDGWKREIDSFRVTGVGGTCVYVQFRKCVDVEDSKKEQRRIYKTIGMFEKRKKVKYADGKMIINISGLDYQVGTYENV